MLLRLFRLSIQHFAFYCHILQLHNAKCRLLRGIDLHRIPGRDIRPWYKSSQRASKELFPQQMRISRSTSNYNGNAMDRRLRLVRPELVCRYVEQDQYNLRHHRNRRNTVITAIPVAIVIIVVMIVIIVIIITLYWL